MEGVEENGRTYASYGKEGRFVWTLSFLSPLVRNGQQTDERCQEYGAPMDEQEMDRIDMAHAKYFMLLEKKRWLAPILANPQKVLDLACGTGQSPASLFPHEAFWERIILIHPIGIWSMDFADANRSADVTTESTK